MGLLPHSVEELHEGVVDHEGDGNVQAHAAETGDGALVETARHPTYVINQ